MRSKIVTKICTIFFTFYANCKNSVMYIIPKILTADEHMINNRKIKNSIKKYSYRI